MFCFMSSHVSKRWGQKIFFRERSERNCTAHLQNRGAALASEARNGALWFTYILTYNGDNLDGCGIHRFTIKYADSWCTTNKLDVWFRYFLAITL